MPIRLYVSSLSKFFILKLSKNIYFIYLNIFLANCGCPTGWTEYNGSCYLARSIPNFFKSAQIDCKNQGGSLVTLNSQDELKYIYSFASSLFTTNGSIWVYLIKI